MTQGCKIEWDEETLEILKKIDESYTEYEEAVLKYEEARKEALYKLKKLKHYKFLLSTKLSNTSECTIVEEWLEDEKEKLNERKD